MTEKISVNTLAGVPETLLVPLYARAQETQRPDAICHDPQAVAMMAKIEYDFSKFADTGAASSLGIAVRTEILDEQTAAYIAQHPNAVMINIAAGLDTRFLRVDNGQIRWFDLDLPEAIEVRRRLLPEQPRQTYIAESALNFVWMQQVEKQPHTLIIIEGLLMYFQEAEVKNLLNALTDHFPGAEMLVEVMGYSQAQRTDRDGMVSKTGGAFQWGIRNAADMGEWHPKLKYIGDVSIYDRHEQRWLALPLQWKASPAALRNTVDRIVQLRVAE
jgi:O-methyltransferase involved in polyketide biosynthesis